ncbi:WDcontaining protein 54 [Angomonas deanei]|uniref:WD repeat-containing protein 54 beta-propeller domain-containing protein n=1 Tax=Angomonas deanei TaxID=59799 RepID=A0A7G2CC12_9TRYP|nr:WDcontaining protein 54 [Angomonas deanei]CAD2216487.1 hypothetical protein, conserved [Angomonas deanei]|eukprot:EPY32933.1 WDcontaining protein 54 [Angomonas deanei]
MSLKLVQCSKLKAPPSHIPNNLVQLDDESLLYASGKQIMIFSPRAATDAVFLTCSSPVVHFSAVPAMPGIGLLEPIILVCSEDGCQVYRSSTYLTTITAPAGVVFTVCHVAVLPGPPSSPYVVLLFGGTDGTLFSTTCGTHNLAKESKPVLSSRMLRNGITCIDANIHSASSSTTTVVTGDTAGALVAWSSNLEPRLVLGTASDTDCAVCVRLLPNNQHAAAGYVSGKWRLFECVSGSLLMEVGAHSRGVSVMAYDTQKNQLITIGEDKMLEVWNVEDKSGSAVRSCCVEIPGNGFISPTGLAVHRGGGALATFYDVPYLYEFR